MRSTYRKRKPRENLPVGPTIEPTGKLAPGGSATVPKESDPGVNYEWNTRVSFERILHVILSGFRLTQIESIPDRS